MPAKIRLGVIGAGWFASRRHCPDIVEHPDAELTALCRRDSEELRTMANAFGDPACFTDYRALLDSDLVDGVVICSPHNLHFEHAMAALQRDLPVLLEKPITIEPAEGFAPGATAPVGGSTEPAVLEPLPLPARAVPQRLSRGVGVGIVEFPKQLPGGLRRRAAC